MQLCTRTAHLAGLGWAGQPSQELKTHPEAFTSRRRYSRWFEHPIRVAVVITCGNFWAFAEAAPMASMMTERSAQLRPSATLDLGAVASEKDGGRLSGMVAGQITGSQVAVVKLYFSKFRGKESGQ